MSAAPRVAVAGTGRMGARMAARLADAGLLVSVWNRSAGPAEQVARDTGARRAATPREAAADADVVLTMLTDGDAVLAVLDGADGVLAGLAGRGTVLDCSTTGQQAALAAAGLCERAGVAFVDAPVSGSTAVAERGDLGVMAGGEEPDLAAVRPVLDAVAKAVVHVGPTGSGAAAKVAVNGLLHVFSTGLAEAVVTARTAGVTTDRLFDVLDAGVLASTFLDYKREAFLDPRHAPVAFDLRTATKDLRLAADASTRAGLAGSLLAQALELHERAVHDGYGEQDMAAMAAWFDDRAGTDPTRSPHDPTPTRT